MARLGLDLNKSKISTKIVYTLKIGCICFYLHVISIFQQKKTKTFYFTYLNRAKRIKIIPYVYLVAHLWSIILKFVRNVVFTVFNLIPFKSLVLFYAVMQLCRISLYIDITDCSLMNKHKYMQLKLHAEFFSQRFIFFFFIIYRITYLFYGRNIMSVINKLPLWYFEIVISSF